MATNPDSVFCNECCNVRRHHIRASYQVDGVDHNVDWVNIYQVLECGGCGTLSFRERFWFSEFQDPGEPPHYIDKRYPPELKRPEPNWFNDLPEVLIAVLAETYDAFHGDLQFLTAVGIRTALDTAVVDKIGDVGSFAEKIARLAWDKLITPEEASMLTDIAEAGHAAAHRGYSPSSDDLGLMLEVLESVLYELYIRDTRRLKLHAATKELRFRVPERPRRKNKE